MGGGGRGGNWLTAPKGLQRRKKLENMGYFHAWELSKLAPLSSLTRKYMLWEGFYHNFSTKKASASGGPFLLDPQGTYAPQKIYPGATP